MNFDKVKRKKIS